MTHYVFVLEGVFVPYVRMTSKGKWVKDNARKYLSSQSDLALQLQNQMAHNGWERLGRQPITVEMKIYMERGLHKQDLDNQLKALLDAAQGVVYENDQWIDGVQVERSIGSLPIVIMEVRQ